jgi:lipopolysaccharide transport system permease protein
VLDRKKSGKLGARFAYFVRHMNPVAALQRLFGYRSLIWQLTWRDVTGRYRASLLGFGWSFITPLVTLAAYTFVFGVVFRSRWPQSSSAGLTEFGLTLYAGLVAFSFFSECLMRAPGIVTSSPNYVKKVVFPLEILPVSVVGSALFHAGISAIVLVLAHQALQGVVAWTALWLPIVFAPLVLLALGATWFLASVGVFFRDVGHTVMLVSQVLIFMTPVFYPVQAVPPGLRPIFKFNPLTSLVENTRRVTVQGLPPDWPALGLSLLIGLLVATFGYAWFTSTKRAFADVI